MTKIATCLGVLLLVAVINGCSTSPEQAAIARAKKVIEAGLLDPGSVQYRNEKVIYLHNDPKNGIEGVCLEYNAKNHYGAYAGFELDYCKAPETNEVDKKFCWGLALKAKWGDDAEVNKLTKQFMDNLIRKTCTNTS